MLDIPEFRKWQEECRKWQDQQREPSINPSGAPLKNRPPLAPRIPWPDPIIVAICIINFFIGIAIVLIASQLR